MFFCGIFQHVTLSCRADDPGRRRAGSALSRKTDYGPDPLYSTPPRSPIAGLALIVPSPYLHAARRIVSPPHWACPCALSCCSSPGRALPRLSQGPFGSLLKIAISIRVMFGCAERMPGFPVRPLINFGLKGACTAFDLELVDPILSIRMERNDSVTDRLKQSLKEQP